VLEAGLEKGNYTLLGLVDIVAEAVVAMPDLLDTAAGHSIAVHKGPAGHRVVAASAQTQQPKNRTLPLRATSILWEPL
jgi:hypothetical protein